MFDSLYLIRTNNVGKLVQKLIELPSNQAILNTDSLDFFH